MPDAPNSLRERVATPVGDYSATIERVASLVRRAESIAGATATVGIGTPGSVSKMTGVMIGANSTVLIGRPLREDLARAIGRPIRMANDANCFLLSEARDGAAAQARVAFGVILGTGVGGAVAVRGGVLEGANGIAGEWGHDPLPWPTPAELPGPECYCGKRGCIETFLSGPALAREKTEHGDDPALDMYEDRLARALASVINILDPDAIVLGGGLSNLDRLYANVPKLLPRYVFSDAVTTRIVKAAHGDSSGVRGAAMLWEQGAYDG